jgi:ribose 5-phosphate isomerase B
MKYYLGADHAGFELKEKVKEHLEKNKIDFEDLGAFSFKIDDDYPDFAKKVAKKVSFNKNSRGILVCGSGIGMCVSANKVRKIRACQVYDYYTAIYSKEHNDCNVICLRARHFAHEKSLKLLKIWMNTKFEDSLRHKRRIKKVG